MVRGNQAATQGKGCLRVAECFANRNTASTTWQRPGSPLEIHVLGYSTGSASVPEHQNALYITGSLTWDKTLTSLLSDYWAIGAEEGKQVSLGGKQGACWSIPQSYSEEPDTLNTASSMRGFLFCIYKPPLIHVNQK